MDGPLAWRVVPEDASVQRAYASLQDIVHAEDKEKVPTVAARRALLLEKMAQRDFWLEVANIWQSCGHTARAAIDKVCQALHGRKVAEHLKKLKIGPSAANTEDVGQSEWVGPLFARPLKRAHSSLAAPSAVAEGEDYASTSTASSSRASRIKLADPDPVEPGQGPSTAPAAPGGRPASPSGAAAAPAVIERRLFEPQGPAHAAPALPPAAPALLPELAPAAPALPPSNPPPITTAPVAVANTLELPAAAPPAAPEAPTTSGSQERDSGESGSEDASRTLTEELSTSGSEGVSSRLAEEEEEEEHVSPATKRVRWAPQINDGGNAPASSRGSQPPARQQGAATPQELAAAAARREVAARVATDGLLYFALELIGLGNEDDPESTADLAEHLAEAVRRALPGAPEERVLATVRVMFQGLQTLAADTAHLAE